MDTSASVTKRSTQHVLFVCLGNICRSPMAEAIFRHLVTQANYEHIVCDSAGTSAYHIGQLPDMRARNTLAKYGISTQHKGRQVSPKDFERFDHIFAMDRSNYQYLLNLRPGGKQVLMFRDYDPQGRGKDVPDPYYDSEKGFEEVYQMLLRSAREFLTQLHT